MVVHQISNAITKQFKQRIGTIFQKGRLCMHIVYIEFGTSKSNQYKKVCNLAKQIPNYHSCDGITHVKEKGAVKYD